MPPKSASTQNFVAIGEKIYTIDQPIRGDGLHLLFSVSLLPNDQPKALEEQVKTFEVMAQLIINEYLPEASQEDHGQASSEAVISHGARKFGKITVFIAGGLLPGLDFTARYYLKYGKEPSKEEIASEIEARTTRLMHGIKDPKEIKGIDESIAKLKATFGEDNVEVIGWNHFWPSPEKYDSIMAFGESPETADKTPLPAGRSDIVKSKISKTRVPPPVNTSLDTLIAWIKSLYLSDAKFYQKAHSVANIFKEKIKSDLAYTDDSKDQQIFYYMLKYLLSECVVYAKMLLEEPSFDYEFYHRKGNCATYYIKNNALRQVNHVSERLTPLSLKPVKNVSFASSADSDDSEKEGREKEDRASTSPSSSSSEDDLSGPLPPNRDMTSPKTLSLPASPERHRKNSGASASTATETTYSTQNQAEGITPPDDTVGALLDPAIDPLDLDLTREGEVCTADGKPLFKYSDRTLTLAAQVVAAILEHKPHHHKKRLQPSRSSSDTEGRRLSQLPPPSALASNSFFGDKGSTTPSQPTPLAQPTS